MSIFKAYDIRGNFPEQINEELVYNVGRALVSFLKCKNVLVARDVRRSSPVLREALVKGITDQGADVIDIGIASTDMFYYAVWKQKAEAGAMITASHNPKDDNGIKITRENAIPIGGGSGMEEIEKLSKEGEFQGVSEKGKVTEEGLLDDFVDFVLSFVDKDKIKPLKVVLNAYNGAGGIIAPKIFEKLKCRLVPMYFDADGNFPGKAPNPLLGENREGIIAKVKEEKADIGIAVDGDCDRAFFIDNEGNFISGDFIFGLLSKNFLKKNPGAKILYDVRCSWYTKDVIEKNGGEAIKHRVGHAFFKNTMHKTGALLAGELSGHYYYRHKELATDNSWIPSLQILEMISEEDKSLADLMEDAKDYHITGEINFKVVDKDGLIKKIEEKYSDGKIEHIDGISVEYDGWRFNLRKSNTEPLVRLNLEGKTKEIMEAKKKEVISFIQDNS